MSISKRTVIRHNAIIAKRNEIIQKTQHRLTEQQQKILAYMTSAIKKGDNPDKHYIFNIKEFCEDCNMTEDSGYYYKTIKKDIEAIDIQRMWMKDAKTGNIIRLQWLNILHINERSGTIEYSFHTDITPYLFGLDEGGRITYHTLKEDIVLTGRYTRKLYELLKSFENLEQTICFDLDRLRYLLNAENYTRYPDFRRFVLEPSIKEINEYTDIEVLWREKKEGRAVKNIYFNIFRVDYLERAKREARVQMELGYFDE